MTDARPPVAADVDALRELEESLWRPGTRFDRAHMELTLHDFAVRPLADGVVQTTYVSELRRGDDPAEYANRSSLWVREDGRWRLRFHQGTPVER